MARFSRRRGDEDDDDDRERAGDEVLPPRRPRGCDCKLRVYARPPPPPPSVQLARIDVCMTSRPASRPTGRRPLFSHACTRTHTPGTRTYGRTHRHAHTYAYRPKSRRPGLVSAIIVITATAAVDNVVAAAATPVIIVFARPSGSPSHPLPNTAATGRCTVAKKAGSVAIAAARRTSNQKSSFRTPGPRAGAFPGA